MWRYFSALLAVVLLVSFAFGYLRSRRRSYFVAILQLAAVPVAALLAYALVPGPDPQPGFWPLLALFFGVAFYALVVWSLIARRRYLRGPITWKQLAGANRTAMLNRLCWIGAATAILFDFEPWFAVLNIAVNVAWAVAWTPAGPRAMRLAATVEIAASAHDVYGFVVDPGNWPRYRAPLGQLSIVSIEPAGPLSVGTRLVTRQNVERGKAFPPFVLQSTEVITDLQADRCFASHIVERPSESSRTDLRETSGGTSITVSVEGVVQYRDAALGLVLDRQAIRATRQLTMEQNLARLKVLLEAVPATH